MSNISRSVLFGKLNTTLYKTLENAYTFCRLRENSYVELVHWLHSLLQTEKTDIFCLINSFNLDEARVRKDVLTAVEKLPAGSTAVIDFSEHIQTLVEQTWTYSSLKFGTDKSVLLIFSTPCLKIRLCRAFWPIFHPSSSKSNLKHWRTILSRLLQTLKKILKLPKMPYLRSLTLPTKKVP